MPLDLRDFSAALKASEKSIPDTYDERADSIAAMRDEFKAWTIRMIEKPLNEVIRTMPQSGLAVMLPAFRRMMVRPELATNPSDWRRFCNQKCLN